MHRTMPHKNNKHTNYYYSHKILPLSDSPTLNLKPLTLKKSFFDPPPQLPQVFQQRNQLKGINTPPIQIVHNTPRWLLLQANIHSHAFFKKLNSGQLCNPYEQILSLFKQFVGLVYHYGYFKITNKMVYMIEMKVVVWINEDIFALNPQMPEGRNQQGQTQFVQSFLNMMQDNYKQWQKVINVFTIDDVFHLLQWRIKLRRGSLTALHASKEVFSRQNQSWASFEPQELRFYNDRFSECRSLQNLQSPTRLSHFQPQLSNSLTIKQLERQSQINNQGILNLLYANNVNPSISNGRPVEISPEVRNTKKKFNLLSTSSTLQKFSDRFRLTKGLGGGGQRRSEEIQLKQQSKSDLVVQKQVQPANLVDELEGLFESERGAHSDEKSELEKIAEQMEEVLLW